MRRNLVGVALVLVPLSAYSHATSHKWIKSGTEETAGLFYECVDQNSIVKLADGRTQFETATSLNALQTCEGENERTILVMNVNCNEIKSGGTAMVKGQPIRTDGKYNWAAREETSVGTSGSTEDQTVRFVCHE